MSATIAAGYGSVALLEKYRGGGAFRIRLGSTNPRNYDAPDRSHGVQHETLRFLHLLFRRERIDPEADEPEIYSCGLSFLVDYPAPECRIFYRKRLIVGFPGETKNCLNSPVKFVNPCLRKIFSLSVLLRERTKAEQMRDG